MASSEINQKMYANNDPNKYYKNGKLNGLSTFYHEYGFIYCEIYYENDVEVLWRDHFVKPGAKK